MKRKIRKFRCYKVKEFLDSYSVTLSNQQRVDIKQYFINLVMSFYKSNLIESDCKTIHKNNVSIVTSVTQLTTRKDKKLLMTSIYTN